MYNFCRFDEVSAIRKPKIIMFSKTGSQILFADLVFLPKRNEIPHNGKPLTTLVFPHQYRLFFRNFANKMRKQFGKILINECVIPTSLKFDSIKTSVP